MNCRDSKIISWLKQNYAPFLCVQKPHLEATLIFDKTWGRGGDKQIASSLDRKVGVFSYRLETFDAEIDFSKNIARLSSGDHSNITVMMRFLSSLMLSRTGGFLLHSCAIVKDGFSYVFFGQSGSGKTTIARLSENKAVLTDETTALVKNNGSWFAYATPFAGEFGQPGQNAGAKVKALFALNKSLRFSHNIFDQAGAVRQLSCSAFLNNGDYPMIDRALTAIEKLVGDLPCYDLYFKATPQIWRYIYGFAG